MSKRENNKSKNYQITTFSLIKIINVIKKL